MIFQATVSMNLCTKMIAGAFPGWHTGGIRHRIAAVFTGM